MNIVWGACLPHQGLAKREAERSDGIIELPISVRLWNCLINYGVGSIPVLSSIPDRELLRMRNFGRVTLSEVHEVLKEWKGPDKISVEEFDGAALWP